MNAEVLLAILQHRDAVFALNWDDQDDLFLGDIHNGRYLNLDVHIALELADRESDWYSFEYIFNKYKTILKHHILATECNSFPWNFRLNADMVVVVNN